jgi:nitrogenase subunit NifH
MVDRHKKMHREIIATMSKAYNGVLHAFIPYLAQIEKMGIYRAPVAEFSPMSVASRSYQSLWDKVQNSMLSADKSKSALK